MKEWLVRLEGDVENFTNVPTTLRSMTQTRSMLSKTNNFLRQYNAKSAMRALNRQQMR